MATYLSVEIRGVPAYKIGLGVRAAASDRYGERRAVLLDRLDRFPAVEPRAWARHILGSECCCAGIVAAVLHGDGARLLPPSRASRSRSQALQFLSCTKIFSKQKHIRTATANLH